MARLGPELAAEETVTLVVQVDGARARIAAPADIDEEAARRLALENPKVQVHLDGRPIRRIIYVPGRLVNVVTG